MKKTFKIGENADEVFEAYQNVEVEYVGGE